MFAIVAVASTVLAGFWFADLVAKPYAVALGRVGQPAQNLISGLGQPSASSSPP